MHPCGVSGYTRSFAPVARNLPAGGHEERVVEEVVVGADGEERGRHPAKVSVQR